MRRDTLPHRGAGPNCTVVSDCRLRPSARTDAEQRPIPDNRAAGNGHVGAASNKVADMSVVTEHGAGIDNHSIADATLGAYNNVPEPPGTTSSMCSCSDPLKDWSLRENRGGSGPDSTSIMGFTAGVSWHGVRREGSRWMHS